MQLNFRNQKTEKNDRIKWFEGLHNHQILEASITGGNEYFIPNENDEIKGRWCPNVFEFIADSKKSWAGLAIVRLLQILPSIDSDNVALTKDELCKNLNSIGYTDDQFNYAFYIIADFGLLFNNDGEACLNEAGLSNLTYNRTQKGTYVLYLTTNPVKDTITYAYLMSTGTMLTGISAIETTLEERRFNQLAHSKQHTHLNFWTCVFNNVSRLFQHIHNLQQIEIEYCKNNLPQGYEMIDTAKFASLLAENLATFSDEDWTINPLKNIYDSIKI
jgi:hypothetical protein